MIWHVRRARHGAVLVLRRHAIGVLLRPVGHVIGVHMGIHVLVVLRRILARVRRRRVRLRMLPPSRSRTRPMVTVSSMVTVCRSSRRRTSSHLHWRRHSSRTRQAVRSSLRRRYVLPSRQMAATHPAGLGMYGRLRVPLTWMRRPVYRLGRREVAIESC